jgi:hypothetical protein
VAEFKVERRPKTIPWEMSADERKFYNRITHAIERYAYDRDLNERFLLAQTQRLLASSLASAYRHWGEKTGNLSLDEEDDDAPKSVPGPLVSALGEICNDRTVLAELERNDTKFERLSAAIMRSPATRSKGRAASTARLSADGTQALHEPRAADRIAARGS